VGFPLGAWNKSTLPPIRRHAFSLRLFAFFAANPFRSSGLDYQEEKKKKPDAG
jgi:hypothetical protein